MKIKNLGKLSDDHIIIVKLITDSKLDQTQLDTLTNILNTHNLTIIKTTDLFVDVKGKSQDLSKLFGITINQFHNKTTNHKYFAHNNAPTIPSELNFITDVIGFNTKRIARTYHHFVKHSTPQSELSSFTPIQIANLYNFPSYTGINQTIAIIELSGGYHQSDLTYYFNSLGIDSPTVIPVGVDDAKNDPSDTSGANAEVVLDIEIACAVAPHSKIIVYFAPNTDAGFYNAIYEAIHDTHDSSIISISWGSAEVNWSSSTMISFDKLFAVAVSKNICIFTASGDSGASDSVQDGLLHVDFPSSSPNVIACGGTHLNSNGTTIQSEVVWNDSNYGSDGSGGGGFSTVFNKPKYQNGIISIKNKRGVPDISAVASPYSGYQIYMDGQFQSVGGTSCVSPLMSGLLARVNQAHGKSIGFINPQLYLNKPCVDIISGNNHGYSASKGWDPCTGLGRIKGELAITKL